MTPDEAITIVTTTCAIPSQPDTFIIDTVYRSVRSHLPGARWLFLFDGIHEIQEVFRRGYEEYKRILLERIVSGAWFNCEHMVFENWGHQGSMIREALRQDQIKTPLVLWLDHDFPFNDLPIDWNGIIESLLANEVCYIRFVFPEETRESLAHLNIPMESRFGLPLLATKNYSSIPHVCRLDFLKRVVTNFVEGKNYLECEQTEGIAFLEPQWRLAVYTPAGQMDRFYSLDGRRGHPRPPIQS